MNFDQHFIILAEQVLPPPGAEEHPVNRILCRQLLSYSRASIELIV